LNSAASVPSAFAPAGQARRPDRRRWFVLVVVGLAQLMIVLDVTVVNIALPSAQKTLHFSSADRQWIITAYALAFGSLLLFGGRLGGLVGRKLMFLTGLGGFAVASAVGGASASFAMLVTARACQGAFAALLAPAALSVLTATFSDPRERGRAFGIFGAIAAGGGLTGLLLGGVLTEYLDWRWCLYVNLLFAAVAAAGAVALLSRQRPPGSTRLAIIGVLTVSASMFCLVYGLASAATHNWHTPSAWGFLVAGVALLAAFAAWQFRPTIPLVRPRVVLDRSRGAAYLTILILGAAMVGLFLFLTDYLRTILGYSPEVTGVAFLPAIAILILFGQISNIVLMPRIGLKSLVGLGLPIAAAGMAWLTEIGVQTAYPSAALVPMLVTGAGIRSSLRDRAVGPVGELRLLFDQSPIAMIFRDRDLRTRRTNAAFRRLTGLPDEAVLGRRPSETDVGVDTALIERTLAEQVIGRGVPVVNMHLEQILPDKRRVLSWSAYRVTDNGQVLGAMGSLTDVTGRMQAVTALRRANARLDLLERAGSQIGATLDIHRTAGELAALAVPELADRVVIDLLESVLQGEDPSQDPGGSGVLRLRRVVVHDAATRATVGYKVGDLITASVTCPDAMALLRGKPLLARNPAEISRQISYTRDQVEALLARGVHTRMVVPLTARGVTLGLAAFCRAEHPEPYDDTDVRLVSDLASRAAVDIDNARLYTREHDAAVTLQRSLLPRYIPQVAGLDIAYRYQPASRAAQVGGDWFDVIPLDDGQVALVVGDVTGHGIHAAALMGQLRTTTAALARLGCPPEQIMAQLGGVVAAHGEEAGATCLYAAYDPKSRRCQLTSAGHPPPALCHPGGTAEVLDLPAGIMLGVGPGRYPATDIDLPSDSVLALYTDGLVEQPGQDISTGMSRLARALAADPARSLDDLCDSVLASLVPCPRDDIALLLARTTAKTVR
jgi:PAS domain S-box-containing protein